MSAIRALYVTGSKGSGQAAYEKYANKVFEELEKIGEKKGLLLEEVSVSSPISFPFSSHALEYGVLPLKVRLSHKNDLVHAAHQGLAHVLLPHFRRKVATCLDVIPFAFPEDYANNWLRKRLLWVMKKGLLAADELITISEFSRGEIEKHLGFPAEKITVAYPAVDHSVFKPGGKKSGWIAKNNSGIENKSGSGGENKRGNTNNKKYGESKQQKTVLYVGSEQPRKNLGVLLASFAIAKKQLGEFDLKFVKVGKPQWKTGRHAFLAKARELGIEKNILFVDSASEQQLAEIYRSADVFVFPSLYEGFGLPPLEAMACGTPVVCSNSASLPEVVGDAALSLPPDNKLYFAKAIVKILGDEKYAGELSRRGLKQARKFTWKAAAQKVFEAYEKVW